MARVQGTKAAEMTSMTVSFDDTLGADLQNSEEFRKEFLRGAMRCMIRGEVELGKSMLRKYVNATLGFVALGKALNRSSKTLMQMLGPKGNPHIKNFFEIVAYLQKLEGPVFEWQERDAA